MQKLWIILGTFVLNSCSVTRETPAPVVNVTTPQVAPPRVATPRVATPRVARPQPKSNSGFVNPVASQQSSATSGTTINQVKHEDDTIVTEQSQPQNKPEMAVVASSGLVVVAGQEWLRPLAGKIVQGFTSKTKGVDVVAAEGTPIVAAAEGKVVYSGHGLKGYGNLIIIKHSNNFLTAYAHNKINLAKENTEVQRGQKIAEVGKTEAMRPLLHFELRKSGNPLYRSRLFSHTQVD